MDKLQALHVALDLLGTAIDYAKDDCAEKSEYPEFTVEGEKLIAEFGGKFTFEELSEEAKDKVREHESQGLDYDWWEYEDFLEVAKALKFTINTNTETYYPYKSTEKKSREVLDIQFSGFWSQGDGASFAGLYESDKPGTCLDAITAYAPQDETLRAIATQLDILSTKFRIKYPHCIDVGVSIGRDSGNYSHDMMMNVDNEYTYRIVDTTYDAETLDENPDDANEFCDGVLEEARCLAKWLYRSLGEQYEYLCSDECIIERGAVYDKEGEVIS